MKGLFSGWFVLSTYDFRRLLWSKIRRCIFNFTLLFYLSHIDSIILIGVWILCIFLCIDKVIYNMRYYYFLFIVFILFLCCQQFNFVVDWRLIAWSCFMTKVVDLIHEELWSRLTNRTVFLELLNGHLYLYLVLTFFHCFFGISVDGVWILLSWRFFTTDKHLFLVRLAEEILIKWHQFVMALLMRLSINWLHFCPLQTLIFPYHLMLLLVLFVQVLVQNSLVLENLHQVRITSLHWYGLVALAIHHCGTSLHYLMLCLLRLVDILLTCTSTFINRTPDSYDSPAGQADLP